MLFNRLKLLAIAATLSTAAFLAACGSDNSSSTEPPGVGISPNGTVITADSATNNQMAVVGSPIVVAVRVTTSSGAPVRNDTITWVIGTGGGSVASKTSLTDANGAASITWTLGTTAGANSLGANISGAAVPITATATVGSLASFTKLSPDSQSVAAMGSVLLTVRTGDQYGNVIPNIAVHWSTTGGTVSRDSTSTGTSGNGDAVFTTPSGASRYVVTATSPGLAPLTFVVKTF